MTIRREESPSGVNRCAVQTGLSRYSGSAPGVTPSAQQQLRPLPFRTSVHSRELRVGAPARKPGLRCNGTTAGRAQSCGWLAPPACGRRFQLPDRVARRRGTLGERQPAGSPALGPVLIAPVLIALDW